jgi:hypothetical protein
MLKYLMMSIPVALLAVSLLAAEPKLAFRSAQQVGFYDFDTGVLRGKMRWDGQSQGICELIHVESGVQVVQVGGSLMCPYRIFSTSARYGDAARDWPTKSKIRDDGTLEVVWPAAESHPLGMAAVYRWRSADTLDLETIVTPQQDMPRFEIFLASYFPNQFRASVYVKPNMFAEGGPALLAADVNPLVDGTYLMFPRDREAVSTIFDRRWEFPPNPVQWSITRMIAGPLAVRKHESSGVAALMMSLPEDCFAVSMPYNKIPPDGVAGHGSLYLSLFGYDLKAGESRTVHSRLVVIKAPTYKQIIDIYEKYRIE